MPALKDQRHELFAQVRGYSGAKGVSKLHLVGGEEPYACEVLENLLRSSEGGTRVWQAAGWPPIATWEREFALPRGRADFVLFHVDGSITVIEVKDGNADFRAVIRGIGQVTMYAVQLGYSRVVAPIRRALAVTAPGYLSYETLIAEACEAAGVVYFPLGPVEKHLVTRGAE